MERLRRRLGSWTLAERIGHLLVKVAGRFNKHLEGSLIRVRSTTDG